MLLIVFKTYVMSHPTFGVFADSPSDFAESVAHSSECFATAGAASSAMAEQTWKAAWRLVTNTMDNHSAATEMACCWTCNSCDDAALPR